MANEDVTKLRPGLSKKKFYVPDVAGKSVAQQIALSRQGYGVPLSEEAQIIANSPKGDVTALNKFRQDKITKQEKQWRDAGELAQRQQTNRLENMADMSAVDRADYMREQENRRLGMSHSYDAEGNGVWSENNTANLRQHWAEDYRNKGKAYTEVMKEQSMMSPADKIIAENHITSLLEAADYMTFRMASIGLQITGSPEEYGALKSHLAAWLELKGTDALAFNVQDMFSAIAHDDIMPTDLQTLVGIGALRVGDKMDKVTAAEYSWNLPEGAEATVFKDPATGKYMLKLDYPGDLSKGTEFVSGEASLGTFTGVSSWVLQDNPKLPNYGKYIETVTYTPAEMTMFFTPNQDGTYTGADGKIYTQAERDVFFKRVGSSSYNGQELQFTSHGKDPKTNEDLFEGSDGKIYTRTEMEAYYKRQTQGGYSTTIVHTQEEYDAAKKGNELILGDKYRIRNFATPQALTPDAAATYFEADTSKWEVQADGSWKDSVTGAIHTAEEKATADESVAYFDSLDAGTVVVAQDVYNEETGKWSTQILYTVSNGWKTYADGSAVDPYGGFYTPEELKESQDEDKERVVAANTAWGGSTAGGAFLDVVTNVDWQRVGLLIGIDRKTGIITTPDETGLPGGTYVFSPTGDETDKDGKKPFKAGSTYILATTTMDVPGASKVERDENGNVVATFTEKIVTGYTPITPAEGNPNVYSEPIYETKETTFVIPDPKNIFDDNNLPTYVTKYNGEYYFDLTSTEGQRAFYITYPLESLELFRAVGNKDGIVVFLQDKVNGYGMSDEEVKEFFALPAGGAKTPWYQDTNNPLNFFYTGISGSISNAKKIVGWALEHSGSPLTPSNIHESSQYIAGFFESDPVLQDRMARDIDTIWEDVALVAVSGISLPTDIVASMGLVGLKAWEAGQALDKLVGKVPIIGDIGKLPLQTPAELMFSRTVGGAVAKGYGIYSTAQGIYDLAIGNLGENNYEKRIFKDRISKAWKAHGFAMFMNGEIRQAIADNENVPNWLVTTGDVVAGFLPMSVPVKFSRMWTMPVIFNRMKSGSFSLVKSINSWATLKAVANYRGWSVQQVTDVPEYIVRGRGMFNERVFMGGKALEGGYLLNDGMNNFYFKNLEEANNFFLTGNKEGIKFGSIPVENSGITFDIGGMKIPLAELPNSIDLIANTLKNNPGRLGRGFVGRLKALRHGEDVSKLTANEIANIASEAIKRGEISWVEMIKISKLLKIRGDEAIRSYLDTYKSLFRKNVGDINKILPENETGEILSGVEGYSAEALAMHPELPSIGANGRWSSNTVAEYWKYFEFTDPRAKLWFSSAQDFMTALGELAVKEGLYKKNILKREWTDTMGIRKEYFHRDVIGREDLATTMKHSSSIMERREWEYVEDGIADGLQYGNLEDSLFTFAGQVYRKIEEKKVAELLYKSVIIKPLLSETVEGKILIENAKRTAKRAGQSDILDGLLKRINRGEQLSGGNIAWLNKNFPDFIDGLKQLTYFKSDRAFRDVLRDVTNRISVRRGILRGEIRNLKGVTKEDLDALIGGIRAKLTAVKDYEKTLNYILNLESPSEINPKFIDWLKENQLGQRLLPEVEKYAKMLAEGIDKKAAQEELMKGISMTDSMAMDNARRTIEAVNKANIEQLQVVVDEVSSLRTALSEELSFFGTQTKEELGRKLANPKLLIEKIDNANSIINKIWKLENPKNKLSQLKTLLADNFPTEFEGRIDDAIGLSDNTKAKELYDDLRNRVELVKDETHNLAKIAGIEKKSAMDLLEKHNFEAVAHVPGVYNRIFDDIVVNGKRIEGKTILTAFEKIYKDKPNSILNLLSQISRGILPLQLAIDFSAMMVQAPLFIGLDTITNLKFVLTGTGAISTIFPESMGYYFGHTFVSLIGDNQVSRYLMGSFRTKHMMSYLDGINHGLLIHDATDFYSGMGIWSKGLGKIKIKPLQTAAKIPLTPYLAFSAGFSAWGEVARVLAYETLMKSWTMGGGTKLELAEFCNLLSGSLMETGRGANQRAIESAMLIAPRYYRANLMILNRMMPVGLRYGGAKRGMTGKMMVEAMGGMMATFTASYLAICYATGQQPKLDFRPKSLGGDGAEAFSLRIGEYNVGIPGFWYGFIKSCAGAVAIGLENPDKIYRVDFNNLTDSSAGVWLQWARGKLGPIPSLATEIITGKDFNGNRIDDKNDYLRQFYEGIMPMAWQTLLDDGGKPGRLAAWGANIVGLRAYDDGEWDKFYIASENLFDALPDGFLTVEQQAKQDKGTLLFWDLDIKQRRKLLAEHPELQTLYDAAEKASQEYDTDAMRTWRKDKDANSDTISAAEKLADDDLKDLTNNGEEGVIVTIVDWRSKMKDIKTTAKALSKDLQRRYSDIYALFEVNDGKNKYTITAFEAAYEAWNNEVWNEDGLYDQYDNLRIQELNDRKKAWMDKYGQFYDDVVEVNKYGLDGDSPLKLFWYDAREKIAASGYWDLKTDREREAFRKDDKNLEIESLLEFFGYTSTTLNPEAEMVIKEWLTAYNLDAKVIPALMADMIPDASMQAYKITDPTLSKKYNDIPLAGKDRERFLIEHPEFLAYYYGAAPNGLGHATVNEKTGKSLIPTWENTPKVEEEKIINEYLAKNVSGTPEGSKSQQIWRCQNPEGEIMLIKFSGLSGVTTRMKPDKCAVLLANSSEYAVNKPPVKSEKEATKKME